MDYPCTKFDDSSIIVSTVLVLSCGQTHRITDTDDTQRLPRAWVTSCELARNKKNIFKSELWYVAEFLNTFTSFILFQSVKRSSLGSRTTEQQQQQSINELPVTTASDAQCPRGEGGTK